MHTSVRPAPLLPLPPSSQILLGIHRRKDNGYPTPPSLPQLSQSRYIEAPLKAGLPSPPEDDMHGTQQPQYNYNGRQDGIYSRPVNGSRTNGYDGSATHSSLASSIQQLPQALPSERTVLNIREAPQTAQRFLYNGPQSPQHAFGGTRFTDSVHTLHPEYVANLPKLQPPQPKTSSPNTTIPTIQVTAQPRKSTADSIHPNLQIPSSINNSGGSLAEFAAQITCLFWFESTETLMAAENMDPESLMRVERLRPEAVPAVGFTKWVVTILTTTQVTQNVILLALLFIYRLKTINPAVKGRSGSEYRLLTVALMLGNKFLDDNTYTNKTWAEVSGISVTEIHVMEVEFLSNMRYSLLASADQWNEWQKKLGKFWSFCDRASKAPQTLPSPLNRPTLPSPPTSLHPSPPARLNQYVSVTGPYNFSPQWSSSNTVQSVSPLTSISDQNFRPNSRKRSFTEDVEEPVAKRVSRSITSTPSSSTIYNPTIPARPRLPFPNLTISTTQTMNGYSGATSFSQNAPLLPPLNGSRAMSTVFPTTPTWTPPVSNVTPTGPQSQHSTQSLGTPSRRHSPRSVQDLLSLVPSPVNGTFPGNPGHISPSVYYQQRNSPYKPIRHVNTLLYPPPSTSMHEYTADANEIHYQPLGKRHDFRSGVVPEYGHQSIHQQWPVLPQPNFLV